MSTNYIGTARITAKQESRLSALKEQAATYGISTPVHISIEIDELEANLRAAYAGFDDFVIEQYQQQLQDYREHQAVTGIYTDPSVLIKIDALITLLDIAGRWRPSRSAADGTKAESTSDKSRIRFAISSEDRKRPLLSLLIRLYLKGESLTEADMVEFGDSLYWRLPDRPETESVMQAIMTDLPKTRFLINTDGRWRPGKAVSRHDS